MRTQYPLYRFAVTVLFLNCVFGQLNLCLLRDGKKYFSFISCKVWTTPFPVWDLDDLVSTPNLLSNPNVSFTVNSAIHVDLHCYCAYVHMYRNVYY